MEKRTSLSADDILPECSKHKDEVLKYYCRAHDEIGCIACMISHSHCEKDYIPDISAQYSSLDEFLNLEVSMRSLLARISDSMQKMKENSLQSEKEYQIAVDAIQSRKDDYVKCINQLEHQLKDEAMTYRKVNKDKMKKIESDLNVLESEMTDTKILLSKLKKENKHNMLYLQAKHAGKEIVNYCERMYEITTRNHVKEMKYLPTIEEIEEDTIFGKIAIETTKQSLCNSPETLDDKKLVQVNIKSESDKKTCYATGLAFLSADQLAIADKANRNVKVVDVSYNQIVSRIELTSSPRDITVIPQDQLAVTLRDEERIQLLSTRKGLTKAEQIVTDGNCRGIKYDDGKLIVAFDSKIRPKIEILRLNGEVLCTFHLNSLGGTLLNEPKCIGLSPDGSQMYVTDLTKMCIFRLSKLGCVTGTYGRHRYMGLAVSSGGSVYACSKSGNTVFQFPDDLSYDETVLTINDGIKAPIALAISNFRNMLYVSCGSNKAEVSNILHVFKIKPKMSDDSINNGYLDKQNN